MRYANFDVCHMRGDCNDRCCFHRSLFRGDIPKSIDNLNDLPQSVRHSIEREFLKSGYHGAIEIKSAGLMSGDPDWYEVVSLARQ